MFPKNWFLLVPALAAMGGQVLVHMEERYIGPFAVLLFVGLFSSISLAASAEAKITGSGGHRRMFSSLLSASRLWQRFTQQVAI